MRQHRHAFGRAVVLDAAAQVNPATGRHLGAALGHGDVDVLVRLHRTKGLGDAFQFDGECGVRHAAPLTPRR